MDGQQFFSDAKITFVSALTTAGTSDVEYTALAMEGFEDVTFITSIGTAAAGNYLKAQGSDLSGSSFADIAGSKTQNDTDLKLVLDIHETSPGHKYVRPVVIRGTSTTVGEVWAIQRRAKLKPPTNNTGGLFVKQLIYSVEGTA